MVGGTCSKGVREWFALWESWRLAQSGIRARVSAFGGGGQTGNVVIPTHGVE